MPCRTGRSRWAGRSRRARFGPSRRAEQVLPGESALPGVGHHAVARTELVAPRVDRAVEPASGGVLPLGLSRQVLAGPEGVGDRRHAGDVRHGMALAPVKRAFRPLRMAPLRARLPGPPVLAQSGSGRPARPWGGTPAIRAGADRGRRPGSRPDPGVARPRSRSPVAFTIPSELEASVTGWTSSQNPSTATRRTGRSSG